MGQFIIFLTNGTSERPIIISSNKDYTIEQFKFMKECIPKEESWYELREYSNAHTDNYIILDS